MADLFIEKDTAILEMRSSESDNYVEVSVKNKYDMYLNIKKSDAKKIIKFLNKKFNL